MSRFSTRLALAAVLALGLSLPAMAYNVVNTSSNVNCLFVTTSPCTVYVTDHVSEFVVSGGSGKARLQSRIHQGQPGSTAAGKWAYRYRIDMGPVGGVTHFPYVDQIAIHNFGPLRQYDYNFDAVATDHVFNVTSGALGTKPVNDSFVFYGWTYFRLLSNPVYAGSYPGGGESSYFFGVVSDYPPVVRNISVRTDSGWVTVTGYAPDYP